MAIFDIYVRFLGCIYGRLKCRLEKHLVVVCLVMKLPIRMMIWVFVWICDVRVLWIWVIGWCVASDDQLFHTFPSKSATVDRYKVNHYISVNSLSYVFVYCFVIYSSSLYTPEN